MMKATELCFVPLYSFLCTMLGQRNVLVSLNYMLISPQSAHFYMHLRIIFKIASSCRKVISETLSKYIVFCCWHLDRHLETSWVSHFTIFFPTENGLKCFLGFFLLLFILYFYLGVYTLQFCQSIFATFL